MNISKDQAVLVLENSLDELESIQMEDEVKNILVTIIQFSSIIYYLCAETTATRPITGTAQCRYR
jgi:hypothetical protein